MKQAKPKNIPAAMNAAGHICKFLVAIAATLSLSVVAHAAEPVALDGDIWAVAPQAEVSATGAQLSTVGFAADKWVKATVPGTVLEAYVTAGVEKEPTYGDNAYKIDKKKYDRNFWYRIEFKSPAAFTSGRVWLEFDGINKDADVYLNGKSLGSIHGFVQRGRYDVTDLVRPGSTNALAVLDYFPGETVRNRTDSSTSPSYICSCGWDWMPTVPGYNMGIHRSVRLTNTGDVSLVDPWIRTEVPDLSQADVSVQVEVQNHSGAAVNGVLEGVLSPGDGTFSQAVALAPNETKTVKLDPSTVPALHLARPRLWWPNGYGEPNLYTCRLDFQVGTAVSDTKATTFGVRKYTYDTSKKVLNFYVNGVRVFAKGGNWGMAEFMLRCRGRDYDTRLRFHKEMNFNMIRNWIGMTTDEAFYDACDRNGVMVWDDFWLNPPRPPVNPEVFRANAIEKIKQVRNHACVALWCGENESTPRPPLNDWLREDIQTYDAGDRHYEPQSNAGNVSGGGPYNNLDLREYYQRKKNGMHSEAGTATFTSYDSFKKFMPPADAWPPDQMWNQHFFGSEAANAGPVGYNSSLSLRYGRVAGIEDYCRKAQLLNLETMKTLFESWLDHSDNSAAGVLIWMSQSAYPSFVWQTYDYYFDTTGSYWGAKTACEPVHIYWNQLDDRIRVVNTSGREAPNLTAQAEIYNADGTQKFSRSASISSGPNAVADCFALTFPDGLSSVHFIKLKLTDAKGAILSENFYWRGTTYERYADLKNLPAVKLAVATALHHENGTETMTADITNPADSGTVALAIRPKVVKPGTDEQVLPVFMNDGYFSLVPGETKHLTIQYDRASSGEQDAVLAVECWNNYPKLDPPPPDPSNLALSRPVTASSSELEASPENVVDGDPLTSWRSRPKTDQPEWLCVDLGNSTGFGRVTVKWEGEDFPKSYEVQASDDAQTWTSVYQTTKGQGGLDNLNGLSSHGRYVRVLAKDRGRNGYQMSELEVFAK
jgi:hypothetical protein